MNTFTKRLAALLLALTLALGLAVPVLAAEPAGQTLAYTTDKILWVGPIPLAGLVVINDEYYMPLEILRDDSGNSQCPVPLRFYDRAFPGDAGDHFTLMMSFGSLWTDNKTTAIKPVMCATPGLELGPVTPSKMPVNVLDQRTTPYQITALPSGAVYDLGGHYPMVRLKSIGEYYGYREDEEGVHICETPGSGQSVPTVTWEEDLAGQAAKSLRVKDTKATLKAFHDYLVNNLTHRDFMDSAYFKKTDPQRHERWEQMFEKYGVYNNLALASRYGYCEDYSKLFRSMCLQAGIPCEQVMSFEMSHSWNRVWLWGKWYHVDVTFDDPGPKPTLQHTYFLISAEKMAKNHTWTDSDYVKPAK